MSPSARETVMNRALSGSELKSLIRADFERLLANDGLLSNHVAYGRISYQIVLRKHLDNSLQRLDESFVDSQPAPPLADPSPDAIASGDTLTRTISSPNAERVRTGIPIPVAVKQQDGTTTVENVQYPPDDSLGDGDVQITDSTPEAKEAFRIR